MVCSRSPDDSDATLEWLTERAEVALQRLGLAYRVMLMATRELGFAQARSTTWRSGRPAWSAGSRSARARTCGTTRPAAWPSASARGRRQAGVLHTLNGSGLALARTVAAIMETYQQADGSVLVPEVIQAAMGTDRIGPPA